MKRRELIAGLGGAVAWPLAARAQQGERVRRIGILYPQSENDPTFTTFASAFIRGLEALGWANGRNLRIDQRWGGGNPERIRMFAKELVDAKPDLIVVNTIAVTRAVQQLTQTIPIVFMGAGDPLSAGLVNSLSHPGGNTTGITDIFPSIAGKWLELLKQAVPHLARVALLFNPIIANEIFIREVEAAAARAGSQYDVKVALTPARNADEVEGAITAFAAEPNGGLIMVPPFFNRAERDVMNRLALQYKLPTIYQDRSFSAGERGLISYGAQIIDMVAQGGPSYVDRILRGAKPGDLPVEFPAKFELVVNLRTAKAIGLTIPEAFLVRADEVIE